MEIILKKESLEVVKKGYERVDIFFFQAEVGIRDDLVTGVQTCALPISSLITVFYPIGTPDC